MLLIMMERVAIRSHRCTEMRKLSAKITRIRMLVFHQVPGVRQDLKGDTDAIENVEALSQDQHSQSPEKACRSFFSFLFIPST